jgi:hypothetical protein
MRGGAAAAAGGRGRGRGRGAGSSTRAQAQVRYSTNPQARGHRPAAPTAVRTRGCFRGRTGSWPSPPSHPQSIIADARGGAVSRENSAAKREKRERERFCFRAFISGAAAGACARDCWVLGMCPGAEEPRALSVVFGVVVDSGVGGDSGLPVAVHGFTHRGAIECTECLHRLIPRRCARWGFYSETRRLCHLVSGGLALPGVG